MSFVADRDNIRTFDEIAAEYFAHLYEKFPFPTDLSPRPKDAEHYVSIEVSDGEERADHQERVEQESQALEHVLSIIPIRDATLSWLYETGYFFGSKRKDGYEPSIHFVTTDGIAAENVYKNANWSSVRFRPVAFDSYQDARLSPKGFEALRSAPLDELAKLTGNERSIGAVLSDEAGNAASEAKKQVISRAIGEVIGHAMKAMSS